MSKDKQKLVEQEIAEMCQKDVITERKTVPGRFPIHSVSGPKEERWSETSCQSKNLNTFVEVPHLK